MPMLPIPTLARHYADSAYVYACCRRCRMLTIIAHVDFIELRRTIITLPPMSSVSQKASAVIIRHIHDGAAKDAF